jgi:hypothetical protein
MIVLKAQQRDHTTVEKLINVRESCTGCLAT